MKCNIFVAAVCAVLAFSSYRTASAVIVAGNNNQSVNGTAGSVPAGFNYWAAVGSFGSGASVYVGNGWAISANHLGSSTTTINGITYTIDQTSVLTNPNDSSPTDLQMLHLQIDNAHPLPSVAAPDIASTSPAQNDLILSIGRGRDRSSAFSQTYNSTFSGATPAVYTGYALSAAQDMRWGNNLVSSASTQYVGYGPGNTAPFVASFYADFTQFGGQSSEFQITPGDSGGGVFRQVGGVWQLTGINIAEGTFANQNPFTSAVFGQTSYMADLSIYRSQIMTFVPEPSSLALAGCAAAVAMLAVVRRRLHR
jgi:hypothetical protein